MKKILIAMLSGMVSVMMFTSCSNDNEFSTVAMLTVASGDGENTISETPTQDASNNSTDDASESSIDSEEIYEVITDATTIEANDGSVQSIKAVVRNGEVTEMIFSYKDADGNEKSSLSVEEYPMTPHPSEWIPTINQQLMSAGVAEPIEGVVGATTTSDTVKVLQAALIEAIISGTAGTIQISVPTSN